MNQMIKNFLKSQSRAARAGKTALVLAGGALGIGGIKVLAKPVGTARSALALNVEYGKKKQLRRQANASEKMYDLQLRMYNNGVRDAIPLHQTPLKRPLI